MIIKPAFFALITLTVPVFYVGGFVVSHHGSPMKRSPVRFEKSFSKPSTSKHQTTRITSKKDEEEETIETHQYASEKNESADCVVRRRLIFSLLATISSASSINDLVTFPANAAESLLVEAPIQSAADTISPENINVIIPPLDTRAHELYTLPNGLRVMLCSDPSSNSAAAAMDVHVGAASDPDSIPGLAHFNEHILFLGTKKYPKEDSFELFLSANGGSSNAYTDSEDTVYYFGMNAEEDNKIAEGLDRFGSFFVSPLFTESATSRELNAIESENSKNLQSDSFRIYQMEKSRANSDHPYSKFYTGNKQTLDPTKKNINLREELIKFWGTYYSASQMSLALVGPQPLNKLKKMVTDAFSEIPNNPERSNIKPEEAWSKTIPFGSNVKSIIPGQGYVLEIVPVADLRSVTLTWPIIYSDERDKSNQSLIKPAYYISHLIGHEGPNSLLSYLKGKGWCNSLGASIDTELSDFFTFEVALELTEKGLSEVDSIIEGVFSYIKMLKNKPIPRYVFQEVLQLNELGWRFSTRGDPGPYVQSLVKSMQEYPPSLYVAGPRRLALKDSEDKLLSTNKPRTSFSSTDELEMTIKSSAELISQLSVDNVLVTVLSKTFTKNSNKLEKWYGTNYSVKPILLSTRDKWLNCAPTYSLDVDYPLPNKFIPTENGLKVKKYVKNGNAAKILPLKERLKPIPPPQIIRNDGEGGRWTVYFKQDEKFGQPKAFAIFQLLTKEVFSSAKSASLAQLYQLCASDKLENYAYDAGLSSLTYDVQVLPRGVRLTFGGFNDKLLDFATYICAKLAQDIKSVLPGSPDEFERYKDRILRSLQSFDFQQPYGHASYYSSLTLQPKGFLFTNAELREAIKETSLEDLTKYVSRLWDSGKGEALLQGNIDKNEALQFVNVIDKTLGFKSIAKEDIPPQLKALPLPIVAKSQAPIKLSVSDPNPSNENSASHLSIQCLGKTEKDHILVEIVNAIVADPFYENLRTKQQLGYIVSAGVRAIDSDTRNLAFVVQSGNYPVEKLTKEILIFLDNVRSELLEPLTDAQIVEYSKSLVLKRTEPDKKLTSETLRNWSEISSGRYQFDRLQKEAVALLSIKKQDILDFWDSNYVGTDSGRRLILTEIVPKNGKSSSKTPEKNMGYRKIGDESLPLYLGIDDIEIFRQQRSSIV